MARSVRDLPGVPCSHPPGSTRPWPIAKTVVAVARAAEIRL
jgi:hypothetical protein